MTARTVIELAELCGASVEGDGERMIEGPAALQDAGPREISFLANPRYRRELESTRAAAVLVDPHLECSRSDLTLLRCANPDRAFSRVVELFAPAPIEPEPGVHPTAWVDPSATVGDGVSIGPQCSVGAGARIGDGCVLHANVSIGPEVVLGEGCELFPSTVLYERVQVGRRCRIHAGAVLGADGFGFEPSRQGWSKIPQYGTVVVEDDVEIGAGSCIDRARLGATRIGAGSKLDNLVHVGHNCSIGPGSLLVAQVGLSGSARLGSGVVLAGQVGVAGHVTIGDGARVGGKGGVGRDLEGGRDYFGWPAVPAAEGRRREVAFRKLPELVARVRELAARVRELEERLARSGESDA